MVQEALNNAHRHAGGQGQSVDVTYVDNYLVINVADGGPGFDTRQLIDWESHLGLAGMRERVESLAGQFEIDSAPNKGTRVLARLPLPIASTNGTHI